MLPVVKSEPSFTGREEYCGLVLLESIQPYFKSGEKVREAISAKNLMVPFAAVRLTDSLNTVHEVLEQFEYPEIPVLDSESAIVGFIRPGQVISEYQRAMLRKNQFTS